MSSLENRVAAIESRFAIHDLNVRYFVACDDQDYDALSRMFVPDARLGTTQGHDAIMELLRTDRSQMGTTIHALDLEIIDVEGRSDRATGFLTCHGELARGGQSLYGALRYFDEYVRTNGRWRYESRRIEFVHVGPWSEIESSLTTSTPVRLPGMEPSAAGDTVWRERPLG